MAVILIVRVPRPAASPLPSVRRKVCARRNRPASACGFLGQPATFVPARKRSDALPVHCALSAMISRTQAGTGSASTMFSIASRRLLVYAVSRVPAGRKPLTGYGPERTVSHARQPLGVYLRQHL